MVSKRIWHLVLLISCFVSWSNSFACGEHSKVYLLRGNTLNVFYDNEYFTIKTSDTFYGYGLLDDDRLFVAYQDPEQAASLAILEVINLKSKNTVILEKIGSVGESNFDVCQYTGRVVYNDSNGVHLLRIENDNTFKKQLILKTNRSWSVFWLDEMTVGVNIFDDSGSGHTKIISIKKK